jgi:hypothetical protein
MRHAAKNPPLQQWPSPQAWRRRRPQRRRAPWLARRVPGRAWRPERRQAYRPSVAAACARPARTSASQPGGARQPASSERQAPYLGRHAGLLDGLDGLHGGLARREFCRRRRHGQRRAWPSGGRRCAPLDGALLLHQRLRWARMLGAQALELGLRHANRAAVSEPSGCVARTSISLRASSSSRSCASSASLAGARLAGAGAARGSGGTRAGAAALSSSALRSSAVSCAVRLAFSPVLCRAASGGPGRRRDAGRACARRT